MKRAMLALLAATSLACTPEAEHGGELAHGEAGSAASRPTLLLLSSLPILFADGFSADGAFSLGGEVSPLRAALEADYRLRGIAVADAASLAGHDLLLMAHPQAQPAEHLVALDQWVRAGGDVLLLADPAYGTVEERLHGAGGMGPAPAFADTGLLGRWGLRLEGPVGEGQSLVDVGASAPVIARSPGRLVATGEECAILHEGFAARCDVGAGHAVVIADADFAMGEEETGREWLVGVLATLAAGARDSD